MDQIHTIVSQHIVDRFPGWRVAPVGPSIALLATNLYDASHVIELPRGVQVTKPDGTTQLLSSLWRVQTPDGPQFLYVDGRNVYETPHADYSLELTAKHFGFGYDSVSVPSKSSAQYMSIDSIVDRD